jgi:hypothetical protein
MPEDPHSTATTLVGEATAALDPQFPWQKPWDRLPRRARRQRPPDASAKQPTSTRVTRVNAGRAIRLSALHGDQGPGPDAGRPSPRSQDQWPAMTPDSSFVLFRRVMDVTFSPDSMSTACSRRLPHRQLYRRACTRPVFGGLGNPYLLPRHDHNFERFSDRMCASQTTTANSASARISGRATELRRAAPAVIAAEARFWCVGTLPQRPGLPLTRRAGTTTQGTPPETFPAEDPHMSRTITRVSPTS